METVQLTFNDRIVYTEIFAVLFFSNVRVSMVREKVREKNIFSRSGNCRGILKFVREFWNLSKSQGKVREF